jgi:3-oxoacyl-[acyl-carrier-protein] synthase II
MEPDAPAAIRSVSRRGDRPVTGRSRRRVVVTGMGVVSPIGIGVSAFTASLRAGRVGVREITLTVANRQESLMAGVVPWPGAPDLDSRDRASIPFATAAAEEALQMAGLDGIRYGSTALILGGCQTGPTQSTSWLRAADGHDHRPLEESRSSEICNRLIERWSIDGPVTVLNTACAASTTALGVAVEVVRSGLAEIALCGGSDELYLGAIYGLGALTANSSQPCSPYSRSMGMNFGEGAGFLVLEALTAASKRGARTLAEIAGYGMSADAYHAVRPDPTGDGPALAVQRALDDAAIDASRIDYVNGHGTGTASNDAMERRALYRVFGARSSRQQYKVYDRPCPRRRRCARGSGYGHCVGPRLPPADVQFR